MDMKDLLPKKESLRRAVRWISEKLREEESSPRRKLIDEAIFRFDLSPGDAEFLYQFFQDRNKEEA
ncbi:MAG: hypothetical protein Kow0042_06420 [Calditrichia bacterium]